MGDGACVEAANGEQSIAIRDSKDPSRVIFFAKNPWEEFLITIKS